MRKFNEHNETSVVNTMHVKAMFDMFGAITVPTGPRTVRSRFQASLLVALTHRSGTYKEFTLEIFKLASIETRFVRSRLDSHFNNVAPQPPPQIRTLVTR
jgi:hypothetical protein